MRSEKELLLLGCAPSRKGTKALAQETYLRALRPLLLFFRILLCAQVCARVQHLMPRKECPSACCISFFNSPSPPHTNDNSSRGGKVSLFFLTMYILKRNLEGQYKLVKKKQGFPTREMKSLICRHFFGCPCGKGAHYFGGFSSERKLSGEGSCKSAANHTGKFTFQ
jgi:hypothetical protein